MKIVELHKRRKSLYGLETDCNILPESYGAEPDPTGLIALDIAVCDEYGLSAGVELTEEKLLEIVNKSYYVRAKRRALWYLERGDMSKKQLVEKLSKSFPKDICIKVAERFEELSLINDKSYANRLAEQLVLGKKMSPSHAAYLMVGKGIDKDLAKEVTANINADPIALINDIVDRRYKNRLNDEKEVNRAIGYLTRRGFSFSDIKKVIGKYREKDYFED